MKHTITISGAVASHVDGTQAIELPATADERAFADYWHSARRVRRGRGYSLVITAPAWVINWIYDVAEVLGYDDEATRAEREGFTRFAEQMDKLRIRNALAGPTRDELIEGGYLVSA